MSWQTLSDFIIQHQHLAGWITFISIAMLIMGILLTPILVAAIPEDYFTRDEKSAQSNKKPSIKLFIGRVLKNTLGVMLILGGILMLVLPGQGLITLLLGLLLTDYPGKHKLEIAIFNRPKILSTINWLRRKQGKNDLETKIKN